MDPVITILVISGLFIIIGILIEDRILGARYICNLFFLIFMVLAPINERINNIVYYNGFGVSELSYYYVSILVLLFSVISLLSSVYFKSKQFKFYYKVKNLGLINFLPWIFGFLYLYLVDWNLEYLNIREPLLDNDFKLSSINYVIADRFCRLAIGMSVFYIIVFDIGVKKKIISVIALFIFCLPSSMPRNMVLIVYLPFILLFLEKFIKHFKVIKFKKFLLNIIIVFVGPFIFILLNHFRNLKTLEHFTLSLETNIGNFLKKGHLDSFQSFQNSIDYVDINWGQQLLGSFLFFIPRSLWENKPTGSGGLIAESSGYEWFNVSANYFAEGYINFGIFGIFFFFLILIFLITINDRVIKNNKNKIIYFYFFPGLLVKLMIGDMLNAFSIIISFIALTFILNFISRIKWYKR